MAEALGIDPVAQQIAARSMERFYRDSGGRFGLLGDSKAAPRATPDGGFIREFQLGQLHLNDIGGTVKGETQYEVEVTLAAVQCFGTQDASNDEPYVVMSLITVDPGNTGTAVQTQRTPILENVHQGDTIFKNALRMQQRFSGTSGLLVHLAVWDHEFGDQDKLTDQINKVLKTGRRRGPPRWRAAVSAVRQALLGM